MKYKNQCCGLILILNLMLINVSCKKEGFVTEIREVDTEISYKMLNDPGIANPISVYYTYVIVVSNDWSTGTSIYKDNFVYKNKCTVGEVYSSTVKIPDTFKNRHPKSKDKVPQDNYSFILFSTDSLLDVTHNNQFLSISNPNSYDLMFDNTIIKPGVKNTFLGRFTK